MISDEQYSLIMDRLSEIEDPELGVNIVDLGLIYNLDLNGNALTIDMTLTSAGCPLTELIEDGINDALVDQKFDISLNWIWSPAWSPAMITEEGKDQLRSFGLSI
jgi:metal-sulfur cluster biosynthetic enzyme